MSGKKLALLGLLAAALVVAALAVLGKQTTDVSVEAEINQPAVPGLKDDLNTLREITVTRAEARTKIDLGEDDFWRIEQLKGYPADVQRIRQFLYQLSVSKQLEKGTANPTLYPQVLLSEETGVRVRLGKQESKDAAYDLLFGKYDATFRGTYIRPFDKEQSWLISGKFEPKPDALFWVDPVIVNLDRARIWQIRLKHENAAPVEIDRERPAGDFVLLNIPKGNELSAHYDIYAVSTAVENMRLSNVTKADTLPDPVKTSAHFLTIDGLELQVDIAPGVAKGTHWAKISARFLPEAILENEEAKKLSKTPEEVQKQVEEINARTGGWIYILDEFPYKLLTKTMEDFTKPVEKAKASQQKQP